MKNPNVDDTMSKIITDESTLTETDKYLSDAESNLRYEMRDIERMENVDTGLSRIKMRALSGIYIARTELRKLING